MVSCSNCGGGDIDQDMSRGSAVCTNCGAVVDDQMIVSEVTFAETSTGGQVMGQYVPQSGRRCCGVRVRARRARPVPPLVVVFVERHPTAIRRAEAQHFLTRDSLAAQRAVAHTPTWLWPSFDLPLLL